MLTEDQDFFVDYVIRLAPSVEIASKYCLQSDQHLKDAIELFADHLQQALSLITPLAAEGSRPTTEDSDE